MPNTKSARKQLKINSRKRLSNRARKSRIRTSEKRLDELVAAKDVSGAQAALKECFSLLDRAAKGGAIHKNTASRSKGRLAKRVHALGATD